MRWDTTIGEALPTTSIRPEYKDVTLLQLLHHRAGVVQDRFVSHQFLIDAAGDDPDPVKAREHYAQFTLNKEPIGKPDEKYAYSNAGYSIAAHMAETMAKKPYEELMRDLVFKPLRMGSAKIGVPGTDGNPGGEGQLMGHSAGDKGLTPYVIDEPRWVAIQAPAGAGVSITVEDLLKFLRYHLDGLRGQVRLMKPENFAVLHKPAMDEPGIEKYACGWLVISGVTKDPYVGHNGTDGSFRSEIAIWPEKNLAIVAIANAGAKYDPAAPLQAVIAVYNRYGK